MRWKKYYDEYRKELKGSDNSKASTYALTAITSDLNDGKVDPAYNIAAQTRIVASYGFLQMTYITATDKSLNGFFKTAVSKLPENLNDQNELMPAYVQLTKYNMQLTDVLGPTPPISRWNGGFDSTWRKIAGWYNPKKKPIPHSNLGYAQDVIDNSNKFLPQ